MAGEVRLETPTVVVLREQFSPQPVECQHGQETSMAWKDVAKVAAVIVAALFPDQAGEVLLLALKLLL